MAKFTFDKDRLVALEGLGSEMQITRKDHYCYGMWTADPIMTIHNACLKRCKILQHSISHGDQKHFEDTRTILTEFLDDNDENPGYLYPLEPPSDTPFGLAILDGQSSPELYCLFIMQTKVNSLARPWNLVRSFLSLYRSLSR